MSGNVKERQSKSFHTTYIYFEIFKLLHFSCLLFSNNRSPSPSPRHHRHSLNEFPAKVGQIFRNISRQSLVRLNKNLPDVQELSNGSEKNILELSSTVTNDGQHPICSVSDSPHYIVRVSHYQYLVKLKLIRVLFKIAGTGNIQEFERLISNDISKLNISNLTGLCAAHNAAARNQIAILALIAQYHGGIYISILKLFHTAIYFRSEY